MKEKHIILNACNALLLIQISDKLWEEMRSLYNFNLRFLFS